MGLRINTNISAVRALRNLRNNDRNLARSLEHLSTGLRIVRASDDPSGLVISEQLRTQVSSLNKAVENSQNDGNLISTADAALGEVSSLLINIRDSATFALNTGAASPQQISAEQDTVDQAISAIDRIANTTRFADSSLLNGARAIQPLVQSNEIKDLNVRSVSFAPGATSATFTVNVNVSGQFATLSLDNFNVPPGSSITLRITGNRGTADVTIGPSAADANSQSVALLSAINTVGGFTGVFASNDGAGTDVHLRSEDVGSAQVITVQVVRGAGTTTTSAPSPLVAGAQRTDAGRDYELDVNGSHFKGSGRKFSIVTSFLDAQFNLEPLTPNGNYSFKVRNSGMFFQLNSQPLPTDGIQIGINAVNASVLGSETISDQIARHQGQVGAIQGGFLTQIRTGGANDLRTNPGNATKIVSAALDQVNGTRGYLGAIQAQTIQPNITSLGVAIENLSASQSSIRDLDFAEETSRFTKNQILFQAGTAVLASANLIPQTVLTLLR